MTTGCGRGGAATPTYRIQLPGPERARHARHAARNLLPADNGALVEWAKHLRTHVGARESQSRGRFVGSGVTACGDQRSARAASHSLTLLKRPYDNVDASG